MEREILYFAIFLMLIAFLLALIAAAYLYARYHHLRGEVERRAQDRAQTLFQQWRAQHEAEIERNIWEKAQAEIQKKEAELYAAFQKKEAELHAEFQRKEAELHAELQKKEEQIRNEAVKQSGAVQRGQVMELALPFLMGLEPEDVRYLGSPVDWIVFRGLRDTEEEAVKIVLVEAKTGKSGLNERQRRLRQAVQEGRVQVAWWTARLEREIDPEESRQGITFRVHVREYGERIGEGGTLRLNP